MVNQVGFASGVLVGPGAPSNFTGIPTRVVYQAAAAGVLWVPGWTVLGGSYSAVVVEAGLSASAGPPISASYAGLHNTYIAPAELSWKLGDTGFFAKAGLGIYVPDGDVGGPSGVANAGNPWWTFQPSLSVSYLKDGWNLTATMFNEMHTANTMTGYTSGNSFHTEFTATKTIGRWTFGPVGYFAGQITDDKSSSFYGGAINLNRYALWAVGGLVGYDFGPAALKVWAVKDVAWSASGGTPVAGYDPATVPGATTVMASLSYRLWAPEAPANTSSLPLFRK